mmetsp:Transcript_63873/g.152332  ORF Transcript_63873/g.152332 Transcript_63873/m.152332 type:complete len:430 (+) Transcript_63873:99-1388(+)
MHRLGHKSLRLQVAVPALTAATAALVESLRTHKVRADCAVHAPPTRTTASYSTATSNPNGEAPPTTTSRSSSGLPFARTRTAPVEGSVTHGPLRIFTGSAHPQLAEDIARHMGAPLGNAAVGRFKCGEVSVLINESVRDCDVFVIQPTCNSGAGPQEHLVELLIMLDAIKRGAANRVTAVMPLFGYSRQSAKERGRSPICAKLVTDLLQAAGADRVLTIELHSAQIQGFASYPIDNMYALPLLARELAEIISARGTRAEDLVVVSPDVNGAKRASALAAKLCGSLAIFSRQRRRPTEPGEIDLVGEVQGKLCIVVCDIADTAESLVRAAAKLQAKGASAVIGAVVHGVLSDHACELINESSVELVLVTDTIPLDGKLERCPKLRVVSVAPLLAHAIQNIHTSQSLSALFEELPVRWPMIPSESEEDQSE